MAILGTGSGTSYPGAVDTYSIEVDGSTRARADVPNDTNAAVVSMQGTLGTNPQGTKADVKTFLQVEHNTDGTHGTITTANTTVVANFNAEQHNGLKVKVIDIGDWNMDSTVQRSVAHDLTQSTIRSVSVHIRNDSGSGIFSLDFIDTPSISSGATVSGGWSVGATNVVLERTQSVDGGYFDNANYDSSSYNRGWITIWYVP